MIGPAPLMNANHRLEEIIAERAGALVALSYLRKRFGVNPRSLLARKAFRAQRSTVSLKMIIYQQRGVSEISQAPG